MNEKQKQEAARQRAAEENRRLINERMIKNGFIETDDAEEMDEAMQSYYGYEFTESWTRNARFYIYTESTADSYELYIATESNGAPDICQEVYQYEHGCLCELPEHMRNGETIYFAEYLQEDLRHEFDEALYTLYADYREDMRNEAREQLESENKLKYIGGFPS